MSISKTAIISKLAEIDPTAEIGPGVIVDDDVRIGPRVKILANAYICRGTDIGEGTVIHFGAVIGHEPQDYAYKGARTFTKIGKNNIIREYVTIHRGTTEGSSTVVGDNNMIMGLCHLGHNCRLEDNIIMVNNALLAGYVQVEKGAFISGNVVFHQFCRVGRYAMIGGFTGVNKDVPPYLNVRGPAAIRGVNLIGLRRAKFPREVIKEVKEAYKILYLSEMLRADAIVKIKNDFKSDEIKHFVAFIEASKRGICSRRYSKNDYFGDDEE